ncbi:MAG TPA: hypothetical protein P5556_03025 [Candidatus Gastranaerophilales bacterium]|nr:hypothetical protein [Candidatus Gastranaerophilales bacterium]
MEWLNLVPLPIALGMVLYVNSRIETHEINCPIHDQLNSLNKKIDMILEHLLGKR